MTTSLTTFESRLREALLDVVYAQWHDLGAPFADAPPGGASEVIDPEALLWCSIEFLATEPRLSEAVVAWLGDNEHYIIRHRLRRKAHPGDPRTSIWQVLDRSGKTPPSPPTEPCHKLESIESVEAYCRRLADCLNERREPGRRVGAVARRPSTVLLQARDLLGGDLRHALLVYMLANPAGAKLKSVASWSGYSYRSVSDTATRWEAAGVLSVDHGYCRLLQREPWRLLLRRQSETMVIVDWSRVFESFIRLLRASAKAQRKGFTIDSAVIGSYRRKAEAALAESVPGDVERRTPLLAGLGDALAGAVSAST